MVESVQKYDAYSACLPKVLHHVFNGNIRVVLT